MHLSGGVGIGGVLEPLQATPTIIEDNCFIGARSEIVEGVIVEEGSVISMGVYIGQSTKIFNRETGEVAGRFGRRGYGAGQLMLMHLAVSDSEGNVYTGEVAAAGRVQKFVPVWD